MKDVLFKTICAAIITLALSISPACAGDQSPSTAAPQASVPPSFPPAPKHVVIVMEENRSLQQILSTRHMPVLHSLIAQGALFTDSHGVTHPSLPNYFALFAGKTNTDGDHCSDTPTDALGDLPVNAGLDARMPTLASELLASHHTFVGYADSLPSPGYVGCYGRGGSFWSFYYKRHVPWAFFTRAGHPSQVLLDIKRTLLPDDVNQPFSAFPQAGHYDDLPTVAMVTPNVRHDMHGTPIGPSEEGLEAAADDWLGDNIVPLVQWAEDPKNATLIIITWDESDKDSASNSIPTLFLGAMVRPGQDAEHITHYNVLATIERFYGLPPLTENDKNAKPITGCWNEKGRP